MRFFNTAGPVNTTDHYCVPPLKRIDLDDVLSLIDQNKYFMLHAPRQTGKTTCLIALMEHLNALGKHKALYFNVEAAQAAGENVSDAIHAIMDEIALRAKFHLNDNQPEKIGREFFASKGAHSVFNAMLSEWSLKNELPLVLLIDEMDALVGPSLISVLRQLRSGYDRRPLAFPQSIVLCGLRDLRDYRMTVFDDKTALTGVSPFNIKAKSLRLGDFTKDEMSDLYACHTDETGQTFDPGVMEFVWTLTEGQPWLVNALGYEACFEMKENRDRSISITREMIERAKENIIYRRETHIDHLVDKLKEERVRRVIEPVLTGATKPDHMSMDDLGYVEDLGLIKTKGNVRIANDIYKEVIPRELTYSTQVNISHETLWYVKKDGLLDMNKLLLAFQEFFREHSESWLQQFQYREAGPHLLLQAFLQRIVNGGGQVSREYALGRMRTDLLVIWRHEKSVEKVVIELKIKYGDLEKTIAQGLEQTSRYMDVCGASHGHLVIFDRAENKSWEEKIFCREDVFGRFKISVWGM